jgi:hypothetical protein
METFEQLKLFHEAYADSAACYRRPTPDDLARFSERVPEGLKHYWETYGWCSFLGGLLWTINPFDYDDVKANWPLDEKALVIARSGFGDLLAVVGPKLLIIYVHTARYEMSVSSYEDVLAYHLSNVEDIDESFWGDLYREGVAALGTPGVDEMFTFEPALALGGEPILECLRRARLKPALAILAQIHPQLRSY